MNESEYSALHRRMKWPLPMKGIEQKIYTAAICILILGLVQSRYYGNWGWFSGSGAGVVVVGIYLAWRDFVTSIGDVRKLYSETIQNYLKVLDDAPVFDPSKPGGIISQAIEVGQKRREIESQRDRALVLCDALRFRIRTTEAFLLGFGTFISGYGSLVPSYIEKL